MSEALFTVDLSAFERAFAPLRALAGPARQQFLAAAADELRARWLKAVTGTALPGMARPVRSTRYARAVRGARAVRVDGETIALSVQTPLAAWLEFGVPPHDLKLTLGAQPGDSVSRNGVPYRVVPFVYRRSQRSRLWPEVIAPEAVEAYAYDLAFADEGAGGLATFLGIDESNAPALADQVASARLLRPDLPKPKRGYSRLIDPERQFNRLTGETWRTGKYSKLAYRPRYRRADLLAAQAAGEHQAFLRRVSKRRNRFITFRTMSASQSGLWIHPGIAPARPIAGAVTDFLQNGLAQLWQRWQQQQQQPPSQT